MQDVPNIVRERLKATASAGDHPDANILTAFAEQSLPAMERTSIIEHLSRCADCRDVVALALPATEDSALTVNPVRGGWFTWPVLRWAFVAAGVVAIASVGFFQYQRNTRAASMSALIQPEQTRTTEARNESPATPTPAPPASEKNSVQLADTEAAPSAKAVVNLPKPAAPENKQLASSQQLHLKTSLAGKSFGGPLMPNQQQVAVQQVPPPPTAFATHQADAASRAFPQAAETVEVSSAAPAVSAQDQNLEADREAKLDQPGLRDNYSKAKAPVTPSAGASAGAAVNSTVQTAQISTKKDLPTSGRDVAELVTLSSTPLWTISPIGALQRSFDQGKTWHDVAVTSAVGGAMNGALVSRAATAKEFREKDADKKNLKPDSSTPVFRAVAANGSEVWAGGNNAALYHSIDGGNHWTTVQPSAAGAALTGDILALEFPDSQHGRVTTSTREVWTTADNGQSWQKQ